MDSKVKHQMPCTLLHVNKECCKQTQSGSDFPETNIKKKTSNTTERDFVQNKLSGLVLKSQSPQQLSLHASAWRQNLTSSLNFLFLI